MTLNTITLERKGKSGNLTIFVFPLVDNWWFYNNILLFSICLSVCKILKCLTSDGQFLNNLSAFTLVHSTELLMML